MDLEQLKLIVDLLGGATESAATLVGWMIAKSFFNSFLWFAFSGGIAFVMYTLVLRINSDIRWIVELRRLLFPSRSGCLSESDKERMYNVIDKLINERNENGKR